MTDNPAYGPVVISFIENLNEEFKDCIFWVGCNHSPIKSTIKGIKTFERIYKKPYYNAEYSPHIQFPVLKFANLIAIDILIWQGDPDMFFKHLLDNEEVQKKKREYTDLGIIYIVHYDLLKIMDLIKKIVPIDRKMTTQESSDDKLGIPNKFSVSKNN